MKYVGAIESLVQGLDSNALPNTGRLVGKKLRSVENRGDAWLAIDEVDSLHLLLTAEAGAEKKFRRLVRFKQRFLKFTVRKWIVSGQSEQEYLDICCVADRKSEYRKPFMYFASDCLAELESEAASPSEAIHRVAQRWHRFWVLPGQNEITSQWTKGLLGELWFLLDLVKRFGSEAVKTWTGAQGHDHDFQANNIAFEIKATETMPPVVQISNLTQLDYTLFRSLWLVVYLVTEHKDGEALPDVLGQLEALVEDPMMRDLLWQNLAELGYRRQLEDQYREIIFKKTKSIIYPVDKFFPSVTRSHFKLPLDGRVHGLRYNVKVAGVKSTPFSNVSVRNAIAGLCAGAKISK